MIETKLGAIRIVTIYVMKMFSYMIQFGWKFHLVNEKSLQHCKSIIPKNVYKEWQITLDLQLVLSETNKISDVSDTKCNI